MDNNTAAAKATGRANAVLDRPTPATLKLVSTIRGRFTSDIEAATVLDEWFAGRIKTITDNLLLVCTEVVRAVESRDQRAIWESAKLAQVQLDKPSPPAPAPS